MLVVGKAKDPQPTNNLNLNLDEVDQLRQYILSDESFQKKLMMTHPEMLEAALINSPQFGKMVEGFKAQLSKTSSIDAQKAALYVPKSIFYSYKFYSKRQLERDPFNVKVQQKIEDLIREENIMQNMEHALEYHPESFGQVHMLYIDCTVNSHPLRAFVDCGAQSTIMMMSCAERCGITRLIDSRFAGVAKGVGEGKIVGRIHSVVINIGKQFLPCSLTILEGDGPDLLFGLDMLKRHQAKIDLELNKLIISGDAIRFLDEHEIPKD